MRARASSAYLHPLRAFAEEVIAAWFGERARSDASQDLLLAFQEALTNVVRHAYPREPGEVEVELTRTEDGVEVVLRDSGIPFDPFAVPPPRFDAPTPGGYGVYIMRTVTDRLTYRRVDARNELLLGKCLVPGPVLEGVR